MSRSRELAERILNEEERYGDDEINIVTIREKPDRVDYIAPAIFIISEQLQERLYAFRENPGLDELVAPIRYGADHFVGINIKKTPAGFVVNYIDPTASDHYPIPTEISSIITEVFGVAPHKIVSTTNKIQSYQEEPFFMLHNLHCGGYIGFILNEISCNRARIKDGRIGFNVGGSWQDVPDLDQDKSDQFGKAIRGMHYNVIANLGNTESPWSLIIKDHLTYLPYAEESDRFGIWKDKHSYYNQNQFLDYIAFLAADIGSMHNYHESAEVVINVRKKLQAKFGAGIAGSRPSTIEFLVYDFLKEVKGFNEYQLSSVRSKFTPDEFDLEFYRVSEVGTRSYEYQSHTKKMDRLIGSLLDKEKMERISKNLSDRTRGVISLDLNPREDRFLLSQIVFSYGYPMFEGLIKNAKSMDIKLKGLSLIHEKFTILYNEMVRVESDTTRIIDDIFINKKDPTESLTQFFDTLITDIISRGEYDIAKEELRALYEIIQSFYIEFFRAKEEEFHMFLWPFKEMSESDISKVEAAAALGDDLEDSSEIALESEKIISENLNKKVYEKLAKLALQLIYFHKDLGDDHSLIPDFHYETVSTQFIFSLFRHYKLNRDFPVIDKDVKLENLISFFNSAFIAVSGDRLYDLKQNLEELSSELERVEEHKTISEELLKFATLLRRSTESLNFLKNFQTVISGNAPNSFAVYKDVIFPLYEGFDNLVTITLDVIEAFKSKYAELGIDIEKYGRKKPASLEEASEDGAACGTSDVISEQERILLAEIEEAKKSLENYKRKPTNIEDPAAERPRIIYKGKEIIKFGNVEIDSNEFKADKVYASGTYEIYYSREAQQLLNDHKVVKDAFDAALACGFVSPHQDGKIGVKPMNFGAKVDPEDDGKKGKKGTKLVTREEDKFVIFEVKLKGGTRIPGFFDPATVTDMGDIRFCGVLRDGVMMISHVTPHGKGNKELAAVAKEIEQDIKGKNIVFDKSPPSTAIMPGRGSTLYDEAGAGGPSIKTYRR